MAIIRVTKEFNFEMAHALWNYDGACKNIHGHSYKLLVTVAGVPLNDRSNAKHGMVIDFSWLKKIVNDRVISVFDHALVISNEAPSDFMKKVDQMFEKYYTLTYQPTCENLVSDIAMRIKEELPEKVKLFSIKLYETTTSYAEWFASDNII